MKERKIIVIMLVLTIVLTIIGSTFAYFNWQSSAAQNTNITFTVGSNFSCSADGGGNITNGQKILAPASCTNSTYAIQRTIVTNVTNTSGNSVYMDLWLDINNIGSGLQDNYNFRYALTTSSSSCTTGIINSGIFYGKRNGDRVKILGADEYASTGTQTYYLYIWLDPREESQSTQDVPFNFSLSGECTNGAPSEQTVYTVNLYDGNAEDTNYNFVVIGSPIPNNITTYNTPEAAMAALKTAGGGTTDYPFFLKHTIGNYSGYCAYEKANGIDTGYRVCLSGMRTQSECNNYVTDWDWEENGTNYTYVCTQTSQNNAVTESYVGFVVTSTMATANPGMTAGTYYLNGSGGSLAYNANRATLLSAFGSTYCSDDPFTSNLFICYVSGLSIRADMYGADVHGEEWLDSCGISETASCSLDILEDS